VRTAGDFARKDEAWVRAHLSKPFVETWKELNGEVAYELNVEGRQTYQSISKTKTFTPPSTDPAFILAQLSKNVENACIKARRWNLVTPRVFFFLKTQDFRYHSCEVRLARATNMPHEILAEIQNYTSRVFKKGIQYRATGIALCELYENTNTQLDLFGAAAKSQAHMEVFKSLDEIAEKYGKHAVFLGSSFKAMTFAAHLGERGDAAERTQTLFKGETKRKRLAIPMLGSVV
jgi:DNA polymerase IV